MLRLCIDAVWLLIGAIFAWSPFWASVQCEHERPFQSTIVSIVYTKHKYFIVIIVVSPLFCLQFGICAAVIGCPKCLFSGFCFISDFPTKKIIREYAQKSKRWTINDGYGFILHANHARRVRAYHWIELLIASIWYSATVSASIHSIRIQALVSFSFGGSTNKRITLVYSFCTK